MESLKSLVKEFVWETKHVKNEQFNLDITPITPRILAMSFPASDELQKWYRNSVKQVRSYIKFHYGSKFHVFNVSGTVYDKTFFNDQVTNYQWEDNHNPSLLTLFDACHEMHLFLLKDKDNVVFVHCNDGKGRTGTLISCYLQYSGFTDSAEQAIRYFEEQRLANSSMVMQPSQSRYITYFQETLKYQAHSQKILNLDSIIIPTQSKLENDLKIQIQIYNVSNSKLIFKYPQNINDSQLIIKDDSIQIQLQNCNIQGNLLIKIFNVSNQGYQNLMCRFGIHSSFLNIEQENIYRYEINSKDFDQINFGWLYRYLSQLDFKIILLLRNVQIQENSLNYDQTLEQKEWEQINKKIQERKKLFKRKEKQEFGIQLIFGLKYNNQLSFDSSEENMEDEKEIQIINQFSEGIKFRNTQIIDFFQQEQVHRRNAVYEKPFLTEQNEENFIDTSDERQSLNETRPKIGQNNKIKELEQI